MPALIIGRRRDLVVGPCQKSSKKSIVRAMEEVLAGSTPAQRFLDLGAGPGSFDYRSTAARVVAVDIAFPESGQADLGRIVAPAHALPLGNESVDCVVCNHTLEHFPRVQSCVAEIERVLKRDGIAWVTVPDARRLDDKLYRFLCKGGGHINPFTLVSLIELLEKGTSLRAIACRKLYSGFVYLRPPDSERMRYLPRRMRWPFQILPKPVLTGAIRWLCYFTFQVDRPLGTALSEYGWGVKLIKKSPGSSRSEIDQLRRMADYVNVCAGCGSGHPPESLEILSGLPRRYRCNTCGELNYYRATAQRRHR